MVGPWLTMATQRCTAVDPWPAVQGRVQQKSFSLGALVVTVDGVTIELIALWVSVDNYGWFRYAKIVYVVSSYGWYCWTKMQRLGIHKNQELETRKEVEDIHADGSNKWIIYIYIYINYKSYDAPGMII